MLKVLNERIKPQENVENITPNMLEDRFRELLVCRDDFQSALEKANKIVGNRPLTKELVQQALLMLDYATSEKIFQRFIAVREMFFLGKEYKAEEIEYLMKHARTQNELKAISGIDHVNKFGIKRRMDILSIPIIQFLQNNFSLEEIEQLCLSSVDAEYLFKAIHKGLLTAEKVQAFRALFFSDEQKDLLRTFPRILEKLTLDRYVLPITQNTRNALIVEHQEQRSRLNVIKERTSSDRLITLSNLGVLFSMGDEERIALINNQFISNWLENFTGNALQILEIMKRYAGDDYLYVLQNCNEIDLFGVFPQELEKRLQKISEIFTEGIPWKQIYPKHSALKNSRGDGIPSFSLSAMNRVIAIYGVDIAKEMFLKCDGIFTDFYERKSPLTIRMHCVENIVGKEHFKRLLQNEHFLSLIKDLAIGQLTLQHMEQAKKRYGDERFLLLCEAFAGDYFILFNDVICQLIPQETLEYIFTVGTEGSRSIFFDIGFHLREEGGTQILRDFVSLPLEKQKILIKMGSVFDIVSKQFLLAWMRNKGNDLFEKIISSGILPPDWFGDEAIKHVLQKMNILENIFEEKQIIQLLQGRTAVKFLSECSQETASLWLHLKTLTQQDKDFFFQNGLILEILRNPLQARTIKEDVGARLALFFEQDPLLRNQVEGLIQRLNILRSQGKDVDLAIRKMVKRLTNPKMTDTEKIWYLFTHIFGEEWLLKGTDPQLVNATFRERYVVMKKRLEDIVELNEDSDAIQHANERNRKFASDYTPSVVMNKPLLVHGKKDFYPQDMYLGYRAAEFLGVHQYQWHDETTTALNFMVLPTQKPLLSSYLSQDDPIAISYGASKENILGVSHVFQADAVEGIHGTYVAKLYDGRIHGPEHKLILCGVPTTTELCMFVNSTNKTHLDKVKSAVAKKPFYVPLIDVENGVLLFSPKEYDEMRKEFIRQGIVIDFEDNSSVDACITRIMQYYSERDQVHGMNHIEHTLGHIQSVCSEIFHQNEQWFIAKKMSYQKFENLTKIAVVCHDIGRGVTEDEAHAIKGSQIMTEIIDYGVAYQDLRILQDAIKQHNMPKIGRWNDDPITQALYDIDKADTSFERGADLAYVKLVLPTIQTFYTRNILNSLVL